VLWRYGVVEVWCREGAWQRCHDGRSMVDFGGGCGTEKQ